MAADDFAVLDGFSGALMKLTLVITDLGASTRYRFGLFTLQQPYLLPD